jgi:hypothetical protein
MSFEKLQEFGSEVLAQVVFRLTSNMPLHGLFLRFAHRERAIPLLPCKVVQIRERP